MLESNTLYVHDEDGKEMEMEILFTFENEEKQRKYVVFSDPQDESGEVYAECDLARSRGLLDARFLLVVRAGKATQTTCQ